MKAAVSGLTKAGTDLIARKKPVYELRQGEMMGIWTAFTFSGYESAFRSEIANPST